MTRHISYVMIIAGIVALFGLSVPANAQHRWTSLDGPYWAKGVDVAYGKGGDNQDWHRYLIGNDGDVQKLFYWGESDFPWQQWAPLATANKLTSYKDPNNNGTGRYAFCTSLEDEVLMTENGGALWEGIPGSDELPNLQFATLEIDEGSPGTKCFAGCLSMQNEASTYMGVLSGNEWDWDQIGESGLEGYNVYDLEYSGTGAGYLVAGTDDGIYRIHLFPPIDPDWIQIEDFDGIAVNAVEANEYHDAMWAATDEMDGYRRLFFTWHSGTNEIPWDHYLEIQPDDEPFDKVVNDIAAMKIYDGNENYQSVYLATEEGLYLLDMVGEDEYLEIREYINFREDTEYFQNSPFRYDNQVASVDYYQESPTSLDRYILVGTTYNVYLITEERDQQDRELNSIAIEELVEGTFISNVKGLSFPDNGTPLKAVFGISDIGLIKSAGLSDWGLKGLGFESVETGLVGTDLAADFDDYYTGDFVMASSKYNGGGTIMYSTDGGDTWENTSPAGDPKINAVDFDLVSSYAYAAGEDESNVWFSTNNGLAWSGSGTFTNALFNDIYSDPDDQRDAYVYAAGSGNVKAQMYNGSSWSSIENGLSSVSDVFQFAKNPDLSALYAATDLGVYKTTLGANPPVWTARTNGTGAVEIGTVVCDPNNPYALLAATSFDAQNPHIWASGDSGRSWIDLPLGDIPGAAHINRLAASQDENSGFVVGTDQGVFVLGNIFRAGEMNANEEWGPGVIILTGEFAVRHPYTLTIKSPCTIYAVYDFDSYDQQDKVNIQVYTNAHLEIEHSGGGEVLFTSSRPSNPQPGDWEGIVIRDNLDVELSNCVVRYADRAFDLAGGSELRLEDSAIEYANEAFEVTAGATLYVDRCEINDIEETGITANNPAALYVLHSSFEDSKEYSIAVTSENCQAVDIIDVSIEGEFIDGIKFTGDSQSSDIPYIDSVNIINESDLEGTGIRISDNQSGTPQGVISNIYISGIDCGIYITGSEDPVSVGPNVQCEEIDWAGIVVEDAVANIEGAEGEQNAFISCEVGITGTYNQGKVRWTDLGKNKLGGELYECSMDFGNDQYEDPGMNSFEDDDIYYLYVINEGSAEDLYAQWNWWGTTELNDIYEMVTEYVIVEPILEESPLAKISLYSANLPNKVKILNAYPNPFNANVVIEFVSPRPEEVSLKVYNVLGQQISDIYTGYANVGNNSVIWDGRDDHGNSTASGVYFCVVNSNQQKDVKKLVLLK